MKCPKCDALMQRHAMGEELSLMRCRGCKGMLLEAGMLERIRTAVRADEFFDTGHPKVGRALDDVDPFDCPVCGARMLSAPHPEQRHVRIEHCGGCGAIFLDAGELIDLSRDSLLERVWEAITGRLVGR
jgi:Zn-finger nucleic acid-binding protein